MTSQHFSASFPLAPAQLFDYLTTPEHLKNWFGKVEKDEFIYEIEGNAHGRIESCTDTSFLITWEIDGGVSYLNVEVTGLPEGHSQLAAGFSSNIDDTKEESAEGHGVGATGVGWDLSLWALQRYVSGTSSEPTSQDYAAFVEESARAWGAAEEAAGVDPETARRHAENTRAFYLGTEE